MLKTAHAMQISPLVGSHACQENACSRAALIAVNLGFGQVDPIIAFSPLTQAHAEKRLAGEEGLDVTDWYLARTKLVTAAE
jgi:hypothetical protein